jgi:hypothetical protein
MEKELNHTVDVKLTLEQMAAKGRSFLDRYPDASEWVAKALRCDFKPEDVFTTNWILPNGAYGGPNGGPT